MKLLQITRKSLLAATEEAIEQTGYLSGAECDRLRATAKAIDRVALNVWLIGACGCLVTTAYPRWDVSRESGDYTSLFRFGLNVNSCLLDCLESEGIELDAYQGAIAEVID